MRREHQRIPAKPHEQHPSHVVEAARRGTRSAGEPIRDNVRLPLESQFGHDFRDVRIHHGGEAQSAAQELAARAYTMGRDVVFAEGSYAPETGEGARVLAHELTHVVQQSARTTPADIEPGRIIDAHDPTELAAERVTETIAAGDAAYPEGMGTVGDSPGPSGGAVVQRWGLGDLWDDVKDVGSTVVSGVDRGVDWAEDETSAGMNAMVDAASGIPVVSQIAQGAAWAENGMVDMAGGAIKGAGDVASGLGGVIAHPLDTAAGIEGMLEHGPNAIPFFGTALKGIHGAYDLLAHDGGQYGNSWGDLAHHLNPLQQADEDTKYMGAVGKGIVAPGDEKEGGGWKRWLDNPVEATSRAATNIAPTLAGVGAGGPIAAGDAAAAAADTAGATSAAADATDAANAAAKAVDAAPAGAADASGGAAAAAAAPQSLEELIQDSLRNAQKLAERSKAEGSRPLTTDGPGRDASIVEEEPTQSPASSGERSAAPATAPASAPAPASSGQGWLARLRSRFGRSEEPTSPSAGEAQSDQDLAERYYRQQLARTNVTDDEANQAKVVRQAEQGYGPRPIK